MKRQLLAAARAVCARDSGLRELEDAEITDMNPSLIVVLVPGGMGSKLALSGITVWDFNASLIPPSLNLDGVRMIIDPALALPWLKLDAFDLLALYDDLISFLGNKGYSTTNSPQNLYLFPFDWRQGMEANARVLADLVNNTIRPTPPQKLLFIAHSSGCLAVRWALAQFPGVPAPLIDPNIVEMLVAAGPPFGGMAGSFHDIIDMPRLDGTFDTVFSVLKTTYPDLSDQVQKPLNKCLMAVTAHLECITQDPILEGGSGVLPPQPYPPYMWNGWPRSLSALMKDVQDTLNKIKPTQCNVSCGIITSTATPTDTGYVLDANDNVISSWPSLPGDGNVVYQNALQYCTGADIVLATNLHRQLLDDPAARAYIASKI